MRTSCVAAGFIDRPRVVEKKTETFRVLRCQSWVVSTDGWMHFGTNMCNVLNADVVTGLETLDGRRQTIGRHRTIQILFPARGQVERERRVEKRSCRGEFKIVHRSLDATSRSVRGLCRLVLECTTLNADKQTSNYLFAHLLHALSTRVITVKMVAP